ncbi:MAG TPA: phosphatase PAP2 family protein [Firmicutes bacterium]|nr:phosphatase PAP2 family protein [Bacillota bacterium]HOQ24178.1 phosphatase PAP2 family protein [Bacillota bacterium]HPT67589.1 phosphatase PAP2 family protein [Bacillota bacterium]
MDKTILLVVQQLTSPLADAFFILMSRLGEVVFYLPFIAIVYWCGSRRSGARLVLAIFFSGMVNTGLKLLFMRPRPIGVEGVRSLYTGSAGGTSFPSGHTQQSAAFWRTLVLLYPRRLWAWLGTLIVLLVGISRIYLGVHWPSDVLAGLVIGCLVASGVEYCEKKISLVWLNRIALLIAVLGSIGSLVAKSAIDILISGFYTGSLLGLLGESGEGQGRRPAPWQVAARLLVGFVGLWLVWACLPWGSSLTLSYFRALATSLWMTAGAPWLFRRLKLEE